MIINIDAPLKQKEITELLEQSDIASFKYVGHPNNRMTCIQFEVDDSSFEGDIVSKTKALIKSTEFGKAIMFRVLEDGKNW